MQYPRVYIPCDVLVCGLVQLSTQGCRRTILVAELHRQHLLFGTRPLRAVDSHSAVTINKRLTHTTAHHLHLSYQTYITLSTRVILIFFNTFSHCCNSRSYGHH
jgi:hypothetical protein